MTRIDLNDRHLRCLPIPSEQGSTLSALRRYESGLIESSLIGT